MRRLASLCAALVAFPAAAAVVVDQSDEELVARADAVVRGTVLETVAVRSEDGARIFTRVLVRVDEAIKGHPGGTLTLTVPGGELGGIGQLVPGAPRFEEGEEVVLILYRRKGPKGWYGVEGLGRGKYKVHKTPAGKMAVPEIEGIELVERGPGGKLVPAPRRPEAKPLEDVLARLRKAAAKARPEERP